MKCRLFVCFFYVTTGKKGGKDEKWREINIVGLAGASCFIWQIAAQYPYSPVITQESRANKEKSRPLLPLFLLSNTFSHSSSVRYKPFSFLSFLLHGLIVSFRFSPSSPTSFLWFVPSTVCPPEGIFFQDTSSSFLKNTLPCCIAALLQPGGRKWFIVGASFD